MVVPVLVTSPRLSTVVEVDELASTGSVTWVVWPPLVSVVEVTVTVLVWPLLPVMVMTVVVVAVDQVRDFVHLYVHLRFAALSPEEPFW